MAGRQDQSKARTRQWTNQEAGPAQNERRCTYPHPQRSYEAPHIHTRLLDANMTVEPRKCQFLKREAHVLGHIIGGGFIKTNPGKIRAMSEYAIPTNPKKLKQVLGLFSFYRRFVRNFSKVAYPLFKLLKKARNSYGEQKSKPRSTN